MQKAENLLDQKYGKTMDAGGPSLMPRSLKFTRTYFSSIFSHLDNNWDIRVREKILLLSIFERPK